MVQVTLTGVGVILIFMSWRFMMLPSLTDQCRDTLRDLREQTDIFFLRRNDREAAGVKRALISLLDSEIKNVHKISLVTLVLSEGICKSYPGVNEAISAAAEEKFSTSNAQVKQFVDETRRKSAEAIVWYIARKDLVIWVLAVLAAPFVLAHVSIKKISEVINEAMRQVLRYGAKALGTRPGRVQYKIEESFIRLETEQQRGLRFIG